MKANIFHAQLIVNELYMIANILSVQLEGMIVADSELPGKLVGTVLHFYLLRFSYAPHKNFHYLLDAVLKCGF